MRRTPFYPYSYPQNAFYVHPASSDYRRPGRRPFPPASTSPSHHPTHPGPRSVINIPVFDSSSASSPPHVAFSTPAQSMVRKDPIFQDISSAAIAIQAHFRGFRVRKHRPLLHLRSIVKARKQLEDLRAELDSPAFVLKLQNDEKERLRFNESIMAIILRLDAIEGSLDEVRSQRKEATKMAIKLQDAIDAIAVRNDVCAADILVKSIDGAPVDVLCAEEGDPISTGKSEQNSGLSGGLHALSENGMRAQNDFASPVVVDVVTAEGMENAKIEDLEMDVEERMGPSLFPAGSANVDQQVEDNCCDCLPQVMQCHEEMDNTGVCGKEANDTDGGRVAELTFNGMNGLHSVGLDNSVHNNDDLVLKLSQGNCTNVAKSVECGDGEDLTELYTSKNMDVGKLSKEDASDSSEFYSAVDETEHEMLSDSDASHCILCRNQLPAEKQTAVTCILNNLDSATVQTNGPGSDNHDAHENACNVENPACDESNSQFCTPPGRNVPVQEAADPLLLGQLPEDIKQLKLLVGKLLMQNKIQSKVLCALTDRLEQLEHQQQLLNCQPKSQKPIRGKRKLRKGSKRSVRCIDNCE